MSAVFPASPVTGDDPVPAPIAKQAISWGDDSTWIVSGETCFYNQIVKQQFSLCSGSSAAAGGDFCPVLRAAWRNSSKLAQLRRTD